MRVNGGQAADREFFSDTTACAEFRAAANRYSAGGERALHSTNSFQAQEPIPAPSVHPGRVPGSLRHGHPMTLPSPPREAEPLKDPSLRCLAKPGKLRGSSSASVSDFSEQPLPGACLSKSCRARGAAPDPAGLRAPAGTPPRCPGKGAPRGVPWSLACDVSETLTASWLLNEFTPIMPVCAGVLPRVGIWLWLRGTLYNASAMSAARFRMISWGRRGPSRPGQAAPTTPPREHSPSPSTGPCWATSGSVLPSLGPDRDKRDILTEKNLPWENG